MYELIENKFKCMRTMRGTSRAMKFLSVTFLAVYFF